MPHFSVDVWLLLFEILLKIFSENIDSILKLMSYKCSQLYLNFFDQEHNRQWVKLGVCSACVLTDCRIPAAAVQQDSMNPHSWTPPLFELDTHFPFVGWT